MSRTIPKSWMLVLVAVSLVQNAAGQCPRPANPRNGEIRFRSANPPDTFRSGTRFRFRCNDVAFMTVPASGMIECVGDRWEPDMQCVPRNCPSLPEFLRGEISYRSGSTAVTARYACTAPGYRLNGERRRTCQGDGTWTGNSPTCRAMAICPELEERDHIIRRRINGRRREGLWTYGSRHHVSCEDGYVLNSSSISGEFYPTIECTRNGWNVSVPTCIDNPVCPPILDEIENGRSTAQNRTYATKEVIEFICNDGYRTTSQSWRACVMIYTINGYISVWHGVTPSCEEITCPSLRGYIENGAAIGTSRRIGANVTFRCDSGYELIGESRLTCSRVGRWNGTLPVCDTGENDCPVLGVPINGHKNGDRYNKYDQVDFSCERGYTLIGSSFRRCRPEGLWSGEPVKCIGSNYFDDVNELSAKFRGSLDSLKADALFEVEVTNDSTNSFIDNRDRLIPLTHNIGLELYFIFDASSSVGDFFIHAKEFAKGLVREIGVTDRPNSLRVGAIVFGSEADVAFHTVTFTTTDEVIAGINNINYIGGGTNIRKAFDVLLNVTIPQSRALHRPGSFKTVFLITDGVPTEGGDVIAYAKAVKEKGVSIHCIGVSEAADKRILRDIASTPADEHLFFLKKYSTLETLIKLVTNQSLDYSECGINSPQALSGRTNDGDTQAEAGFWPWQVLFDIKNGTKTFVCGGTLIKADWILTAAHCFQGISSYKAYAGIIDRHVPRQELKLETPTNVIIHPDYDNATKRNDIALIQLIQPAKLSVNVRTACLPDPAREAKLLHRSSAVMTGWGHNGVIQRVRGEGVELHSEQYLQQLTLPLHQRADCEASLEGENEENWFDDSMTCAGYLNRPVGSCKGDSGGPLVKYAKVGNKRRWVVIGINSWGIGCALQDELDFFTNVPHFFDWINETISRPDAVQPTEPAEPVEPAQ